MVQFQLPTQSLDVSDRWRYRLQDVIQLERI